MCSHCTDAAASIRENNFDRYCRRHSRLHLEIHSTSSGAVKIMSEDNLCEKLIEAVKENEHLYNIRSENYKDSFMKENTWRTIAESLGIDVNEAKKRWKTLRDTYAKKKKEHERLQRSGSGATKREKWPYFALMDFLRDQVKTRSSFCSLGRKDEQMEGNEEESQRPTEPDCENEVDEDDTIGLLLIHYQRGRK